MQKNFKILKRKRDMGKCIKVAKYFAAKVAFEIGIFC